MAARGIPRDYVREKTLARVRYERERFIAFIQKLFEQAGSTENFADRWPDAFVPNLWSESRAGCLLGAHR